MAYREFVDEHGTPWKAWAVIPGSAERRGTAERRVDAREENDRRVRTELRIHMDEDVAHGWLAFERDGENRRLRPIPLGWEDLSDPDLAVLCRSAEMVTRTRPRPSE